MTILLVLFLLIPLVARGEQDYLILEDFSTTSPGSLPKDWTWRKQDEKKPKLYQVQAEKGRYYLAARDTGSSVILGKPAGWDLHTYPIMTWCWKATVLPIGGDERQDHTNDSAAGIYVIFSTNWLGIPRQIKYVWSSTLPEGQSGRRNKVARPYFIVAQSGEKDLGQWVFEQVDLYADHKRLYGKEPPTHTVGLGILTDANSTDSYAEAYYADLRAWTREAQAKGLIKDYCSCFDDMPPDSTANSLYYKRLPIEGRAH